MDIDITDMDIRTGMDVDYNMGGMFNNERKLAKFLIMFDNSNLLYFPGQFLSGRVIVELADEMAITGRRGFISSIFRFCVDFIHDFVATDPHTIRADSNVRFIQSLKQKMQCVLQSKHL